MASWKLYRAIFVHPEINKMKILTVLFINMN